MDLRQVIEEGCARLEVSERELARRAGLGVGTLTLWKKGQRSPRLEELQKLAGALGMPVLQLVASAIETSRSRPRMK